MSVRIRRATPDDAAQIHAFIVQLAVYEKEPDAVVATPTRIAADMRLPSPPFECLMAEDERGAAGFALFFHNYSTWRGHRGLYLEDLFVLPERRGQGIGRALLEQLARIAVERRCDRFEWMVLDWNEPAIEFYKSLGALPLASWTTWRLTGPALHSLAAPH